MGRIIETIGMGLYYVWVVLPYILVAYLLILLFTNFGRAKKKNPDVKGFDLFQDVCGLVILDLGDHVKKLFNNIGGLFGKMSENQFNYNLDKAKRMKEEDLRIKNSIRKATTPSDIKDDDKFLDVEFKELK